MDYGQFLIACVDEYISQEMAYVNEHSIDYDDLCDYWVVRHDDWMDNIFCYLYIDHEQEACPNWDHAWNQDLKGEDLCNCGFLGGYESTVDPDVFCPIHDKEILYRKIKITEED